jgi:hypothetical protein
MRMFGPIRKEVVGGWKRLRNEELHNLYTSPNIIRVMKLRRMEQMRNSYNILVGKFEGKRPLGRPRHRWEGNVRMGIREIGWEEVEWSHVVQVGDQSRHLVNMTMNFRAP